jgi:phospholipase/carboxylesterase
MNLPLQHLFQEARVQSDWLVIVLHGRGDSAHGFLWLQRELNLDPLNFLLLTAPAAYYTGFSWYDLPPDQLPGILRSRALLTDVFRQTTVGGYPPERTFLLGFSQGCLMTLEWGARHSQSLAGYIGISGYCYDPALLLQEMNPEVNRGNWLITHGAEDEALPVEVTRAQIQALNHGGFKIDYREYRKPHTIDAERELPEIREWIRKRCGLTK